MKTTVALAAGGGELITDALLALVGAVDDLEK